MSRSLPIIPNNHDPSQACGGVGLQSQRGQAGQAAVIYHTTSCRMPNSGRRPAPHSLWVHDMARQDEKTLRGRFEGNASAIVSGPVSITTGAAHALHLTANVCYYCNVIFQDRMTEYILVHTVAELPCSYVLLIRRECTCHVCRQILRRHHLMVWYGMVW